MGGGIAFHSDFSKVTAPRDNPGHCNASDVARTHLAGDMIRLPDRKGHDGQRRVCGGAGGEDRTARDEEIGNAVDPAVCINDALSWVSVHSGGSQVMTAALHFLGERFALIKGDLESAEP